MSQNKTFSIALLGAGFIGKLHAKNLASHPNVNLSYVVEMNESVGKSVAEEFGSRWEPTADKVFNDPSVDAVWIATSAATHSDLIRQSIKAGKAVFCEKPLATDVEDAKQLVEECSGSDLPVFIGFNRRFDITHNRLKNHILEGDIGIPEVVNITSRDPSPPPADYVAGTPGGVFYDTMIHDFDMALWLLDEKPCSLYAVGSALVDNTLNPHRDIDTAAVTMKTASGKICQIDVSRRAVYGYDQRVEVLGSTAMVQSKNQTLNGVVVSSKERIETEPLKNFFIDRYTDSYVHEIDSFIKVLKGEEKNYPNLESGYMALFLSMAALESAMTGKPVEF